MIYSNEFSSNIFYKEILDNYDKEKQQKILEKLINIIITNENNNYFYSEEAIKEIEQEYNKNKGTFYNLSIISSSNNNSSQNFNSLLSNHFLNNNTSSKESSEIYDKEISNNSNYNNNNYNFFNDSNPETTISNKNNFTVKLRNDMNIEKLIGNTPMIKIDYEYCGKQSKSIRYRILYVYR